MRAGGRLAALLLALAFGLTACGDTEEVAPSDTADVSPLPAPTVSAAPEAAQFAMGYAPGSSLDPLAATDQSDLDVASLVYEGLYRLDSAFEAQPVLAQSSSVSADGLTWTITVRGDAAFSSGEALTAQHVASSLQRARTSPAYAARLAGVASVQAAEGAVVIGLTAPNGDLPALLDVPVVLDTGADYPLGTGPYVIDGDGESLWLAANPNWWQGRTPPYDLIPLHPCSSPEEWVTAFDGGQVTALTTDFGAANALGYSGTYETHDFATTAMLFVGFRTSGGVCASAQVRTAISRAFDREGLVSSLLSGHGTAASLPVHPASAQYSQSVAGGLDYDMDSAASLLEEAGYALGEDGVRRRGNTALSLRLVVDRDSTVKTAVAGQLAQALRALGAEVTVEELGWTDYTAALAAGRFDLYLGEVKLTGDFDCTALVSGALNYGGYADAQVAQLLSAWRAAAGQARTAAAQALWEALAADLPFAPLCFKNQSLLVRWGMVENLAPVQGSPFAGVEDWQTEENWIRPQGGRCGEKKRGGNGNGNGLRISLLCGEKARLRRGGPKGVPRAPGPAGHPGADRPAAAQPV